MIKVALAIAFLLLVWIIANFVLNDPGSFALILLSAIVGFVSGLVIFVAPSAKRGRPSASRDCQTH